METAIEMGMMFSFWPGRIWPRLISRISIEVCPLQLNVVDSGVKLSVSDNVSVIMDGHQILYITVSISRYCCHFENFVNWTDVMYIWQAAERKGWVPNENAGWSFQST